jgi:hypothetical protein
MQLVRGDRADAPHLVLGTAGGDIDSLPVSVRLRARGRNRPPDLLHDRPRAGVHDGLLRFLDRARSAATRATRRSFGYAATTSTTTRTRRAGKGAVCGVGGGLVG